MCDQARFCVEGDALVIHFLSCIGPAPNAVIIGSRGSLPIPALERVVRSNETADEVPNGSSGKKSKCSMADICRDFGYFLWNLLRGGSPRHC